jgi:hypothetical protein
VEQSHYIQWLGRLTRVDERQLTQRFQALSRTRIGPGGAPVAPTNARQPSPAVSTNGGYTGLPNGATASVPRPAQRNFGVEEYLLGLLVQSPDQLAIIQDWLTLQRMTPLSQSDFQSADNQTLYAALANDSLNSLEGVVGTHLESIRNSQKNRPALTDETLTREVILAVLKMREQRLRAEVDELEFLMADAKKEADTVSYERYSVRIKLLLPDMERLRALTQAQRHSFTLLTRSA